MAVSSEMLGALGAYLKAQVQNALIIVVLFIVGFAAAGVPWWFATGLFCGVLQLIPYLGSILALALGVMLRWFAGGDWTQMALVGAIWLVIQIIDGFVLSPRAAGRAGVNPFLSILITIAAGMLFGPLGVILAVPVVAIILVMSRATRRGNNAPGAGV